jgi:predicted DNA-binding transcriptional regulator AlpA
VSTAADERGMTRDELLALPATIGLPTAGRAIGIGRNQAYDLAARGEFPCKVLKLGSRYKVVTSDLLQLLGIAPDKQPGSVATTEPDAATFNTHEEVQRVHGSAPTAA